MPLRPKELFRKLTARKDRPKPPSRSVSDTEALSSSHVRPPANEQAAESSRCPALEFLISPPAPSAPPVPPEDSIETAAHRRAASAVSSSISFLSNDTLDPPADLPEYRERLRAEYTLCYGTRPFIPAHTQVAPHLSTHFEVGEPSSANMSTSQFLDPRAALARDLEARGKEKAIKAAKEMQATVIEKAKRMNHGKDPGYEFLELIGKGAFGKVFKSVSRSTNQVVAVKIIDLDASDYKLNNKPGEDDDTLKDFFRETEALKTLREKQAKNINVIYDCFNFASDVWIVSEYCPGGSVSTLMQATPDRRFSEKYIIPIARELSEALRWVHSAGIIHRDVKASNVLVSEDGRVQLCDFGVSGILESKVNKRSTILGTPHWMPPEMLHAMPVPHRVIHYGTEVDIWSFGCTLYELATGHPPNVTITPQNLRFAVKNQVPRLEDDSYSLGLREIIALCLDESPKDRPSIETVHSHYYLFNTARRYPTASLRQLLKDYKLWEQSGGQRQSLFMSSGGTISGNFDEDEEEPWNFSTTEEFDLSLAAESSQAPHTPSSTAVTESQSYTQPQSAFSDAPSEAHRRIPLNPLERLFDRNDSYNYLDRGRRMPAPMGPSDLPLREQTENSTVRSSVINIPEFGAEPDPTTNISDMSTIRGNKASEWFKDDSDEEEDAKSTTESTQDSERRATMDWKFPFDASEDKSTARPKTQDWKFPVMTPLDEESHAGPSETIHETVSAPASPPRPIRDIDESVPRPSTADNANAPYSPEPGTFSFGSRIGQDQAQSSLHRISRSGPPRVDSVETIKASPTKRDKNLAPELPSFLRPRGSSLDDEAIDVDESDRMMAEAQRMHRRNMFDDWKQHDVFDNDRVEPHKAEDIASKYHPDSFRKEDHPRAPMRTQARLGDHRFPGMDRINAALIGNRRPPIAPLDVNQPRVGRARGLSDSEERIGELFDRLRVDPSYDDAGPANLISSIGSSSGEEYEEEDEVSEGEGEEGYRTPPRTLNLLSIPMPEPPSAEALSENGRPEVLEAELTRVLTGFVDALGVVRDNLAASMDPADVPMLPMTRQQRRAAERAARRTARRQQ
ncbi:MAG: hypothetical protein M1833_002520 [Piccolia ochrophora]|nr:MAG: hypothetical protein M1833_002520 [Piccolia ochrophora]